MKKGLILGLTGMAFVAAACSADPLSIPNPNSPTVAGASVDPGALQLQATGITRQLRGGLGAYITTTARFGREGYIYTPNEGRNTSHYLIGLSGQNRLDPTGFAVGVWGGNYGNLRDIFNFKNVVSGSTTLSAAQQSAALGFARTLEALELLYVIAGRDSLGAVVQINQNASDLAPFVSRDSVYRYILGTLDAADTDLGAGGAAFPFVLHSGFAGFNTPTTFRQFNRAIRARASVYFATRGGGNALYTQALTALAASFLNGAAANAAAMDAGVYHVYSTATGDATNGVGQNADYLTHPSYATDIAAGDLRASKWTVLATARNAPQSLGIATNLAMNRYAANNTRVPVVRNEELILLRAEARWFTNDKANAIADLNTVRSVSGGLGATTVTVGSTDAQFIDALLYERRFSLLSEGHRWVDHRRFDRLADLPRDITTGNNAHFVARVMPIPQAECLVRARANDPALAGPGC